MTSAAAGSGEAFDLVVRDVVVPAAALAPIGEASRAGAAVRVDLAIRGERLAAVGPALPRGAREIDGRGRLALPGLIDNHVHYREPGAAWKEGYVTGTSASLRGGATTVGEIQNNAPLVETAEQWRAKVASLAGRARTRVLAYGCATKRHVASADGRRELRELARVAPGIKLFLAADGELEVSDRDGVRATFEEVAAAGGMLVLHAEMGPRVRAGLERFGDRAADFHLARSSEAERDAIELCNELSAATGARLHYFHVSSALACEAIRAGKARGLPISGAACAHYLTFTCDDVAARGAVLKCNPSIKTAADRVALRAALRDGTLDVVQSDHAPHPRAEKLERPFRGAPSGIPGADLFAPLWLALVDDGVLTLDQLVERGARGPAQLHRLDDRGALAPGLLADVVLVDELDDASATVQEADFASKAKLSPYVGRVLRRRPGVVLVGGKVAYDRAAREDVAALEAAAPPPMGAGGDGKSGCC